MGGTASVPNVIFTQPTGNLAGSVLDANWTSLVNYINNRELTIDILANRPAAGTSGRYYFATDANGGTLYADTGSTWTQIAFPVGATGQAALLFAFRYGYF